MTPGYLEIHERDDGGALRLSLVGELDMASLGELEDRLVRLHAKKTPARLDLSRLEFIDSTGLRLLIRTLGDARIDGWQLEVEPDLTPEVRGLFKLVHLDRIVDAAANGRQPSPPSEATDEAGA